MVVIREMHDIPSVKDEFESDDVEHFRILALDEDGKYFQELWREEDKGKENYVQVGETIYPQRRGEPLRFIPFIFIGTTSVSPSVSKPPLLDLVEVNLSHYRTSADLEHGRHFTALPTPWVSGLVQKGAQQKAVSMGSGVAWRLEANGRAGMLEFSGAGLNALVTADQEKRKMMATLGARLLEEQNSASEPTVGVEMRHAGERASLKTIAQATEFALTLALRYHIWWLTTVGSVEELFEVRCEINKDFFKKRMSSDEMRTLMMLLQAEVISWETWYMNLQKGEIARPGVSAEEEDQAIIARSYAPPVDEFSGEGNAQSK
jgi:hypothetical protein